MENKKKIRRKNRKTGLIFDFSNKTLKYENIINWLEEYHMRYYFKIFFKDGSKTNTFAKITKIKKDDWYIPYSNNTEKDVIFASSIKVNDKFTYFIKDISKIEVYLKKILNKPFSCL